MIGIDVKETSDFVSSLETDKERPTVFRVGMLTNRDKVRLFTGVMTQDARIDIKALQERAIDLFIAGCKGISGLRDKTGKEIKVDVVDEEAVNLLPYSVLMEVVTEIVTRNFLSEGEKKN